MVYYLIGDSMIEETLEQYLQTHDWDFTDEKKEKLLQFLCLVQKVNPLINLVSKDTEQELVNRHLQDCLQILHFSLPLSPHQKWIDIGSGGGFPGVIAAILFPSFQFFLVKSIRKKVSFLIWVSIEIALHNVQVLHERAENVVHLPTIAHSCSVFSARGVGTISYLYPYFQSSLNHQGKLILWKNPEEISSFLLQYPAWEIEKHIQYPVVDTEKHIVVLNRKLNQSKGRWNVSKNKKFCPPRARPGTH
jgi:16S rRNA (guanine527-N7)-methyltransferase